MKKLAISVSFLLFGCAGFYPDANADDSENKPSAVKEEPYDQDIYK